MGRRVTHGFDGLGLDMMAFPRLRLLRLQEVRDCRKRRDGVRTFCKPVDNLDGKRDNASGARERDRA